MSCGASLREPHQTIGYVIYPHSMNDRECTEPWQLIHLPEKPKPYPQHPGFSETVDLYCSKCRVGVGPSAPNLFAEIAGGEWGVS